MRSLALLALAACWSAPHPPGLGKLPGLVWITERPAYRAPAPIWDITVDGNLATIVGANGVLARIDLATGAIVKERRVEGIHIINLVRLDPKRWLAVGTWRDKLEARIIDDATFAASPFDLHPQPAKAGAVAGAVKLPDGTIAIAGSGLPLATYDPKTLERVRTLDPETGWHYMHVDGTRLLAYGNATTAAWDLTTGARTKIDFFAAAHGSIVVRHAYSTDNLEVRDGDKLLFDVHGDVLDDVLLDPAGTHMYVAGNGQLRTYELPGGRELPRLDLGWRGRKSVKMTLANGRMVLASGALVQVVDLERGTFTPAGAPLYGAPTQLVVRNDGAVLAIERSAWRFVDGKLAARVDADDRSELNSPLGEVGVLATYSGGKRPLVVLRAVDGGAVVRRWKAKQPLLEGWLGHNGEIVLEDNDIPQHLLRSNGEELVAVATIPMSSMVADADVDSGGAIVSAHGEVGRVRLVDGSHDDRVMRMPGCDEYGKASLERGGDRALTSSDHDIIAWQRGKDDPIGSAHFEEEIGDATFLPGGGDVVLDVGESLALWNPATGAVRTLALGSMLTAAPSPDGKRLAIAFGDGRVALVELAPLRAAMKTSKAVPVEVPARCPGDDLFRIPADERPIPDSDGEE